MLCEVINEYKTLTMHVTELIKKTGYHLDYVAEKPGFSSTDFYKKRKAGNGSVERPL